MVRRGEDITRQNLEAIIDILVEEEIESLGIVKNSNAINFLRKWFNKEMR